MSGFRRAVALAVIGIALGAVPSLLPAQQQQEQHATPDVIDRIVAVVGDRAILLSEVDEVINTSRDQNQPLPDDSVQLHQLRLQALDNMIDEEVLYQKARRDTSITVTDAEVQNAVDQQYRSVRGRFPGEVQFRAALAPVFGTPEEYRRYLTDQSRRQAYGQRYMQRMRSDGKLRSGTVSDAEMRTAYEEARRANQLPTLPPTITFRQVVVSPKPSDAARQVALQRAESVRVAIERGADFSEMARRFSDDSSSAVQGGDLGFFRRGMMVRQFEEVAFSLRPGVVSPATRTEFGYHLIIVDRIQPGEIKARHILFAPVVTAAEGAVARARADTVAAAIRRGANLDSLARIYGDSAEPRTIPATNRDSLPGGYAPVLHDADSGQVVGPSPLTPDAPDRTRWLVAQVTQAQPSHVATYEELRDRIRSSLIEQKGMRNLFTDLRRQIYVDMRL